MGNSRIYVSMLASQIRTIKEGLYYGSHTEAGALRIRPPRGTAVEPCIRSHLIQNAARAV